MKIANIDREILLTVLRNLNEIFRKNVTYDNIKSQKNQGFTPCLEDICSTVKKELHQ